MVFGTFDRFHPGHQFFLRTAKTKGDYLTVVIALDATVKHVKGKLPIQSQTERLNRVQQEKTVDVAVLGNVQDKYQVIRDYRPDIICLGYDQTHFTKNLSQSFPSITIVRLPPHQADRYKSSLINHHD